MTEFTIDTQSGVNTYTTSYQQNSRVTGLSDGGWVVTWMSQGQDGDSYGIYQRRYGADGTPSSDETLVNSTAAHDQEMPSVTGLSDGGWVVTWMSNQQTSNNYDIYQQRYNSDGSSSGGEVAITSSSSTSENYPVTTALSGGGWVTTWSGYAQSGYFNFQQQFDQNGAAVGGVTTVNSTPLDGYNSEAAVTALPDGGWVVIWANEGNWMGSGNNDSNIYQQRYDSAGHVVGSETIVAALQDDMMGMGDANPSVTVLADGGWVVSWSDDWAGTSYMQRYDANGAAVNGAITVNGNGNTYTFETEVVATPDGGWAVIWSGYNSDYSSQDLYMQLYDADGNTASDVTLVNTISDGSQYEVNASTLADGRFVITWTTYGQSGDNDIAQTVVTLAETSSVTLDEDTPHSFTSSEFDFSVESGAALVSIHVTSLPGQGSLTLDGHAVSVGDTILAGDLNKLVWAPDADANGSALASFNFTSLDDNGVTKSSRLSFDVTAVNDAPTAANNTVTLIEDGSHAFSAADFNFADIDTGDSLASVIISGLPSSGTLLLNGITVHAGDAITAGNLGNLVWTPAANAEGASLDGLKFKVTDGNGGTSSEHILTFNVTAVADAPTASNATIDVNQNGAHTFASADFGFNDVDGDAFSYVYVTNLPQNGTLTLDGVDVSANQQIAVDNLGDLVWTPAHGATGDGLASLTFVVEDSSHSQSSAKTLTFDVAPNAAPTAADNTLTLAEDGFRTFTASDFGFSDVDGDTLASITITTLPENGLLTLNGYAVVANQVIDADAFDALKWTPDANANGSGLGSFSFKVTDSRDATSTSSNTITFNISAANDAPTAANNTINTNEDTAHTFTASEFGFADIDSGDYLASVKITSLPSTGSLTLNGVSVSANQEISVADIGGLIWTPPANQNGTFDQLAFKVKDSGGLESASSNHLVFNVVSAPDAPTAANSAVTLEEDGSHAFDASEFGFADVDGDTLASVTIVTLPGAGSLLFNGEAVTASQVILAADIGDLVWSPAADANGNPVTSFTFKVTDSSGLTSSATYMLDLDVNGVNDAPIAVDDKASLKEGKSLTVDVLSNDHDIDGDTLAVSEPHVTSGNGSVTVNNAGDLVVSYNGADLDPGEKATIKISYTAFDGHIGSEAVLTVTVTGVAEAGDDIYGTPKPDTLNGTSVGERIFGRAGNDVINGRGGDDVISAGAGNDRIDGGAGNDRIGAGNGNDRIDGGAGNDQLSGWGGNDILKGGAGADIFLFHRIDGKDRITDFDTKGSDHDQIDISVFTSIDSFKDLKSIMTQHGDDVVIKLPSQTTITLEHTDLADLTRDHFIF